MTQTQWFLLPLFIHFALISYVGTRNLMARIAAVRGGATRLKDIALDSSKWPNEARKFGNNYSNQFEIPTTWYSLCALLVATGKVDAVQVALTWLFVAARLVHTFIHTGSNAVPNRMFAFLASFAALAAMWIWLAVKLFIAG